MIEYAYIPKFDQKSNLIIMDFNFKDEEQVCQ
jgi:hypothetical protein